MHLKKLPKYIYNLFLFLLRNPYILYIFIMLRFFFLKRIYGIKQIESSKNIQGSNAHNLKAYEHIEIDILMKRFDRMLFSVLAIERVSDDSNILIIGNRTESDIFKLNSYGFKKITAIDLITYSPKVTLMDAHSMSFQDNSFDIVLLPYVLPYTKNPRLLSSEIIRVTKNNGIVSIAIDYEKTKDIKSIEDIKNLFSGCINNINFIYNHELSNLDNDTLYKKIGLKASAINLTFSLKK
jgi:hypothetical protein